MLSSSNQLIVSGAKMRLFYTTIGALLARKIPIRTHRKIIPLQTITAKGLIVRLWAV